MACGAPVFWTSCLGVVTDWPACATFCRGDAAFCSEDCRDEQMDMDEALHAAARRHRLLQHRSPASSSSQAAAEAAASTRPSSVMRRRPTIANLAARNPPVAAS